MLQRDYIMRMLQEFFKDLDALFHGKQKRDGEISSDAIEEMHRRYLKNTREYYIKSSTDDLIASYENAPDGIYQAEMLAALLHREALLRIDTPLQKELLAKSLALYRYINIRSKNYSSERLQIIDEIEELLQ